MNAPRINSLQCQPEFATVIRFFAGVQRDGASTHTTASLSAAQERALPMSGPPPHGLWWRIAGPIACLVLLVCGIVAFSKPRYAYFLTFSFAGQIEGALQARIGLDDGPLVIPVVALGDAKLIHIAALPARTIRSILLIAGQGAGAGTIRDVRIVKLAARSGLPHASDIENARNAYRQIDLNSLRSVKDVRITKKEANSVLFETL